jgi:hypothetical protein
LGEAVPCLSRDDAEAWEKYGERRHGRQPTGEWRPLNLLPEPARILIAFAIFHDHTDVESAADAHR